MTNDTKLGDANSALLSSAESGLKTLSNQRRNVAEGNTLASAERDYSITGDYIKVPGRGYRATEHKHRIMDLRIHKTLFEHLKASCPGSQIKMVFNHLINVVVLFRETLDDTKCLYPLLSNISPNFTLLEIEIEVKRLNHKFRRGNVVFLRHTGLSVNQESDYIYCRYERGIKNYNGTPIFSEDTLKKIMRFYSSHRATVKELVTYIREEIVK